MTRGAISAVVGAAILGLVAFTVFMTMGGLERQTKNDVYGKAAQVRNVTYHLNTLKTLGLLKKMEEFATDPDLGRAIKAEGQDRYRLAQSAFDSFQENFAKQSDIWLLNTEGKVVAKWRTERPNPVEFAVGSDGEISHKEISWVLKENVALSSFWVHGNRFMRVGIAPVLEYDSAGKGTVIGAVVVGAVVTDKEVRAEPVFGERLVYFYDGDVYATKLPTEPLTEVLAEPGMGDAALRNRKSDKVLQVKVKGHSYYVTAGQLPRNSTKPFPETIPPRAGFLVLLSIEDALAPLASARTSIWLLGIASLIIAILGIVIYSRRVLGQAEQLQLGIAEVVNGNVDYIFPPVGKEMDGVAAGLNVMLSRLLGRPEPGTSGFQEGASRMSLAFDDDNESDDSSVKDATNLALAKEPEQDYLKRIFEEYLDAKKQLGEDANIAYDKFITKVRLNEGKLKERLKCSAVRFRVLVKNGKVTLKPVPIV